MTGTKMSKPVFPAEAASQEYATSLDAADPLREFRDQFIIPSKANLATKKLAKPGENDIPARTRNIVLIIANKLI